MKIEINKSQLNNSYAYLLQRAGYKYIIDRHTGKESFVRELSRTGYPRLHLYLEENNDNIILNLHLDQKKPLYKGQTAHSGEYDGVVVEEEVNRLKVFFGDK
jgi:hypothetical protein